MLFNTDIQIFDLPDAHLVFDPTFLTKENADGLFTDLQHNIAWQQGEIMMFGKKVLEPRLTAWYGDAGKSYRYSGKTNEPLAWTASLLELKAQIEERVGSLGIAPPSPSEGGELQSKTDEVNSDVQNSPPSGGLGRAIPTEKLSGAIKFNSVLLNHYRNGNDSMGFHADNERELGQNPVIASVNLGTTRRFQFRRRDDPKQRYEIELTHGSLLIMAGAMQHHWTHAVPKAPKELKSRINLTFRYIC